MSNIELIQVDSHVPSAYCKQCGFVDNTGGWKECKHEFKRVIVVCDYAGIWQRKQIEGLYDEQVSLLVSHLPNADWRDTVDLHFFESEAHLEKILREIKTNYPDAEIITHNYGNRTPLRVLQHFPQAIVVIHDIHTLGIKEPLHHEARLIETAERLVFPSQQMLDGVRPWMSGTARAIVQHQMVPRRYFKWQNPIVDAIYQGRIKDSWADVFRAIREEGKTVKVMPSILTEGADYSMYGSIEPSKNYAKIIAMCSRSRWGLVGSPSVDKSMQRSMSNKFYDYIAAGAVPIILNHPAVAETANRYGIGVIASSTEEIIDAMRSEKRWKELRSDLYAVRDKLTMESQREEWEQLCSLR